MDAPLRQTQHYSPQVIEVTGQPVHRVTKHCIAFADEALHGLQLGPLHILAGGSVGKCLVQGQSFELANLVLIQGADPQVAVGWFGGQCNHCEPCRRGIFVDCQNLIITGVSRDGGYAEMAIVEARALAAVPDDLTPDAVAPLVCVGVTTFNALRKSGLGGGATVGVHGIGGLGHMAIQFARKMGFRTVAIARGSDKEELARRLGAHEYIDNSKHDAVAVLNALGGADAVLTASSNAESIAPLVAALRPHGQLIALGIPL